MLDQDDYEVSVHEYIENNNSNFQKCIESIHEWVKSDSSVKT